MALTNPSRSAIIMAHDRGVAQLAEQPSPKRQVARSIRVAPASKLLNIQRSGVFLLPKTCLPV